MSAESVTMTPTAASRSAAAAIDDTAEILLEANVVTRRFGGLVAVKDVDLRIPRNSIISIIGPNGAGKTTFFNVVAGLIDPTSGTVSFRGNRRITRSHRIGSSRWCGWCRRPSRC